MPKDVKLTTKQKWSPVDAIINNIEARKSTGGKACLTDLDEYINHAFNTKKD